MDIFIGLYRNKKKNYEDIVSIDIRDSNFIENVIIPFFDNLSNSWISKKYLDYQDFKGPDSDGSDDQGEYNDEEDNSNQENNSNPENNSNQDSDDDRRSEISSSDDLWSGDPRELKTKTIESFIENIEDLIPDLEDNKDVEAWNQRKSDLEEELYLHPRMEGEKKK